MLATFLRRFTLHMVMRLGGERNTPKHAYSPECVEGDSVLKNSLTPPWSPDQGLKYPISAVFWTSFGSVGFVFDPPTGQRATFSTGWGILRTSPLRSSEKFALRVALLRLYDRLCWLSGGYGSAWRCTNFHSPSSGLRIIVTRRAIEARSSLPPTLALVRSAAR
jgi:hypothetical protein